MVSVSIREGRALPCYVGIWVLGLFMITCTAKQHQYCAPSSCGKVTDISYPFRLKQDPHECGDRRYELDCVNNVLVLYLNSAEYHVEAINYINYTIRLVDPGIQEGNCSSMPRYFLSCSNFSGFTPTEDVDFDFNDQQVDSYQPTQAIDYEYNPILKDVSQPIIYLECEGPVRDDTSYEDTTSCLDDPNTYAVVGDISIERWKPGCHVKAVSFTPWTTPDANVSYIDIHRGLVYGFELSWMQVVCDSHCGSRPCYFNNTIASIQCYVDSDTRCYYINGGAHSCGKKISQQLVLTGMLFCFDPFENLLANCLVISGCHRNFGKNWRLY